MIPKETKEWFTWGVCAALLLHLVVGYVEQDKVTYLVVIGFLFFGMVVKFDPVPAYITGFFLSIPLSNIFLH